jgi:dTDP-4-dehydrorhamnose 3,5-epimerase
MVEINEDFNINGYFEKCGADVEFFEDCGFLTPNQHTDHRGTFRKIHPFNGSSQFNSFNPQQISISFNDYSGTIRGLHFQNEPYSECKVVTCIRGSIFDVLLDLRPESKTYKKWISYVLSPSSPSLLIAPRIAHGFQTLEDNSQLLYIHSNEYSISHSKGVNPFDPELRIKWPLSTSRISDKDLDLPNLKESIT